MDANQQIIDDLRALFAPVAARLAPDVEPAFRYVWRDAGDERAAEAEDDDQK